MVYCHSHVGDEVAKGRKMGGGQLLSNHKLRKFLQLLETNLNSRKRRVGYRIIDIYL